MPLPLALKPLPFHLLVSRATSEVIVVLLCSVALWLSLEEARSVPLLELSAAEVPSVGASVVLLARSSTTSHSTTHASHSWVGSSTRRSTHVIARPESLLLFSVLKLDRAASSPLLTVHAIGWRVVALGWPVAAIRLVVHRVWVPAVAAVARTASGASLPSEASLLLHHALVLFVVDPSR